MRPAWRRHQRIERRKALRRHLREQREAQRARTFDFSVDEAHRAQIRLFAYYMRRTTFTFQETAQALRRFHLHVSTIRETP